MTHLPSLKSIPLHEVFARTPYVVLRHGKTVYNMSLELWNERDKDYGPNHKPVARQYLDNGWVKTDEKPVCHCRKCWSGRKNYTGNVPGSPVA